MLLNRFLLSLVAALFLSTLASANSTNVTAFLHSGAFNSANHAGPFSTVAGNSSPAKFAAYSNHRSIGAIGNTGTDAAVSGKVTYGGGAIGRKQGALLSRDERMERVAKPAFGLAGKE